MSELDKLLDLVKIQNGEKLLENNITIRTGDLIRETCEALGLECIELNKMDGSLINFLGSFSNNYIVIYSSPWILKNIYYSVLAPKIEVDEDTEIDDVASDLALTIANLGKDHYIINKRQTYAIILSQFERFTEFDKSLFIPTDSNLSILFTAQHVAQYSDTIKNILLEHVDSRIKELDLLLQVYDDTRTRRKLIHAKKLLKQAYNYVKDKKGIDPVQYYTYLKKPLLELVEKMTGEHPMMEIIRKEYELKTRNGSDKIEVLAFLIHPATKKLHYI